MWKYGRRHPLRCSGKWSSRQRKRICLRYQSCHDEKGRGMGVHLAADDEDLCAKSDIILLAVKPQNAAEALAMCKKALDGKSMMSIVAGVTVERLRAMIDGTPRILRLLPNTPAMVFEGAFAICSDNDFLPEDLEIAKSIYSAIGIIEMVPEHLIDAACALNGGRSCFCSYVY